MNNQIKWSIDRAYIEMGFKVRHSMIADVEGSFKTFVGSVYTKGRDFTTAEIHFWIDPASIETGQLKQNEQLKSKDFFNVEKHQEITFKASTIGKANDDVIHDLWGKLTIVGITKKIKLAITFNGITKDSSANERAGFTITGKVKRSDWGLVWKAGIENENVMVSDEVSILCEVELINIGFKYLKTKLIEDENQVLETMQKQNYDNDIISNRF